MCINSLGKVRLQSERVIRHSLLQHVSRGFFRLQNCGMSPASIIVTKDLHLSYGIQSSLVQYKLSDIGEGIREVSIKEWFVRLVITLPSLIQSVRCRVTRHQLQLHDGIIRKLYYSVDDTALVGQPLVDIQ